MLSFRHSYRTIKVFSLLIILLVTATAAIGNAQTIFFDPSDTVPTDPNFDVVIAIDCGADLVKGIELIASYDPALVQLNSISAGAWYNDSGQGFSFFDYTSIDPSGTIHFASAVLDGTLGGAEVLAVCHFSIIGLGISPLVFQDVDVRDGSNQPLTFGNSTGDQITIDPAVVISEQTFGTLKVLYR